MKTKLNSLFSQFDAMKTAAAAYDDYWAKRNAMRVRVTFRSQSPYKWKTANGADIFNASDFSKTVGFGEGVSINLRDTANAPYEASISIDTGSEGEQSRSAGGARLNFDVKVIGEKPPRPETLAKPPSKPSISDKLR